MTLDESLLTPTSSPPASPFLPGTQIQYALDSTSLGLMKTCWRKYQLTILEGWTTAAESTHLRFGIEYHAALEHFDRLSAEGIDREAATHQVVSRLMAHVADWQPDPETKAGRYKNRQTLVGLVLDYLDHYHSDPAKTYIKSDGTPAVELSFRFELDWGPIAAEEDTAICRARDQGNFGEVSHIDQPYLLCGHLDRVVEFNSALFVMDHKTTTTTLSDYYFSQYEPNNQMSLYTLAGKIILNAPIKGVIVSAAQIKLEEPNTFVRRLTYRTPDQLDEWLLDLRFLLNVAEANAESGYWPQNDTACDKYGGCPFRSICSKDPSARERFLRTDFIQLEESARWNPLVPR